MIGLFIAATIMISAYLTAITALTRAKGLAVLVGTRKALAMAVKNRDTSKRQTSLKELLN